MAAPIDEAALFRRLQQLLAARGPAAAAELTRALGISQPTFSRLAREHASELLVVGKARATRYALRREIDDVGRVVPVYEILEDGSSREVAALHAVAPQGFYVQSQCDDVESRFYDDVPYFLDDMRPAGFLGRLIPSQHPELELPADIRHWNADHAVAYWAHHGWNLPGSFVVGDEAFRRHLAQLRSPAMVSARRRKQLYPKFAQDVLTGGPAGSSAGGEQPKFLATATPGPRHVLVKFSPKLDGPVGRRYGDLLIAEHLAHRVLVRHGRAAPASRLIEAGKRIFLEVERFDRTQAGGRRGVISLLALDAEFVGHLKSWTESVARLSDLGRVPEGCVEPARFFERFGQLIANTDLHFGNLGFFTRGERILDVAPAYDMVPMLYAPQAGNLPDRRFVPPLPEPDDAAVWAPACRAAVELWNAVAEHPLASRDFRRIARENASKVERAAAEAARLPQRARDR